MTLLKILFHFSENPVSVHTSVTGAFEGAAARKRDEGSVQQTSSVTAAGFDLLHQEHRTQNKHNEC